LDAVGDVISEVYAALGALASSFTAKSTLIEVINDALEASVSCGEEREIYALLTGSVNG
jgi:hypothetical protein